MFAGGGLRSGGRRIVLLFQVRHGPVMAFPNDGGEDLSRRLAIGPGGFDGGHGGFAVKATIGQGGVRLSQFPGDGGEGGDGLFLVVGRVADALPDDEPAIDFNGKLGVVALLEAASGFASAALPPCGQPAAGCLPSAGS